MITALCMPSAMTRASYSPLSFGSRNRTECVTSSLATTSNPALKCNVWTSAAYTSATGARNVCRATGTRFTAGVEALILSSEEEKKLKEEAAEKQNTQSNAANGVTPDVKGRWMVMRHS